MIGTIIIIILFLWAVASILLIIDEQNKIQKCEVVIREREREIKRHEQRISILENTNKNLINLIDEIQPWGEIYKREKCRRGNWCEDCEYSQRVITDFEDCAKTEIICKFGCPCKNLEKRC